MSTTTHRTNLSTPLAFGFAFCLAVAASASPALAKTRAAPAGYDAYAEASGGELGVRTDGRMSALRDCNSKTASYREYTWGEEQSDRYRSCMAGHG